MSKWCKCIVLSIVAMFSLSDSSYGQESESDMLEVAKIKKQALPAYWTIPPPIRLCTGSGVTEERLSRALRFWERLGYQFGSVIVDNDSYTCVTGGVEGEITILLFTQGIIDG